MKLSTDQKVYLYNEWYKLRFMGDETSLTKHWETYPKKVSEFVDNHLEKSGIKIFMKSGEEFENYTIAVKKQMDKYEQMHQSIHTSFSTTDDGIAE